MYAAHRRPRPQVCALKCVAAVYYEVRGRYLERMRQAQAAVDRYKKEHDLNVLQERRELAELEAAFNEARAFADKVADLMTACAE